MSECLRQNTFVCTKKYEIRPTISIEATKFQTVADILSDSIDALKRKTDHQSSDNELDDNKSKVNCNTSIKKKKLDNTATDNIVRFYKVIIKNG